MSMYISIGLKKNVVEYFENSPGIDFVEDVAENETIAKS